MYVNPNLEIRNCDKFIIDDVILLIIVNVVLCAYVKLVIQTTEIISIYRDIYRLFFTILYLYFLLLNLTGTIAV